MFKQSVQSYTESEFEAVASCQRVMEFTAKEITKGDTLKKIMEEEQIPPDEVAVFGDGENDLTMFGAVKYCFAMENALDIVKQKAYRITASNHDKGIKKALDELGC